MEGVTMGAVRVGAFALCAVLAIPALASGSPDVAATITAHDSDGGNTTWWEDGAGNHAPTVHITAGQTVAFKFEAGAGTNSHNVTFPVSQPSSCEQTAGTHISDPPPLPTVALPAGWAGDCTFNTTGTYSFVCSVHPMMTGTIIVDAAPTPTPTP